MVNAKNLVDYIIDYESGELEDNKCRIGSGILQDVSDNISKAIEHLEAAVINW